MMEAYVQSGQLSGMLSGLAGSVTYENLLGQPGTGNTYWVALQGGLAVVIALILVGIILAGIFGWLIGKISFKVRGAYLIMERAQGRSLFDYA